MVHRTVGVFFGSRSVEHDVSIVTAHQTIQALQSAGHTVIPIYITRTGEWYTGEGLFDLKNYQQENIRNVANVEPTHLSPSTRYHGLITPPMAGRFAKSRFQRIDVAFSTIHGTHGEDGTIQGLFEMADIPYVGTGVLASAIANHKAIAKSLLQQAGIPVVEGISFTRYAWLEDPEAILAQLEPLGYPLFIKPATLGSSIGVAPAHDMERLRLHIDIAASLSTEILVEKAITNAVEINCAVMGNYTIEASVLEQPMSTQDFLTYEEKYLRGEGKTAGMKGADRIIPAPISDELTRIIQEYAIRGFKAIRGRGIARIDFLVQKDTHQVYLNEINTMPGSISFYLWKASGKSPIEVVNQLIDIAFEVHAEKRQTTYDYQSKLLELAAQKGIQGVKK